MFQPDGTIMKVAIDFASARPRIGTPQPMLMTSSATYTNRQSWLVHPDGERILRVVEGENSGGDSLANRVHFVINWFTELDELMR